MRIFGTVCGIFIIFWLFLSLCINTTIHADDKDMSYPISAWPLLYQEKSPEKGKTDVLWPFYRHEWEDTWNRYSLNPLIFSTESDPSNEFRTISFLWRLNTYTRDSDSLDMNLTLYWHGTDKDRTYTTLFPVYWIRQGKDPTYFHIWPLFGVYHNLTSKNYSTMYPFFQYEQDPAKGEVNVHLFWPLMNYRSYPGYLSHRFFPVYMYEKGPDITGGYVFPYYWRDAADFHARGVFPIWYSSQSQDQKNDMVFPLYFNRETKDSRLRLLFPLYGNWTDKDISLQTILPVYFDYKRPDFSLRLGFPIYWDYRDGPFSFTSILPVYYRSKDAGLGSCFEYFFPVYGTYRVGDTYTRHLLFMPLYSQYKDEGLKIEGRDFLWPMLHYETGQDRFSAHVFPFLWIKRSPEASLSVGLPFYFSYKDQYRNYMHIVPFYGKHTRGNSYQQTYHLGPLYIDTRDTDTGLERTDIFFPFFSRIRQNDSLRSWLFPLYSHREEKFSRETFASLSLLPPYYYNYHKPTKEGFILWPFYNFTRQDSYLEYGVVWPLLRYGYDKTKEKTLSQIVLFYRDKDNDNDFSTLFPIWWHRSSPELMSDSSLFIHSYEQNHTDDETRFALFWIFDEAFGVLTYHRQKENMLATRFLYQVISYERSGPDTDEFRLLWRFVRSSSTQDKEVFELNPLYYRETDKGKASYWAILGGLIGCRTTLEDEQRTMRYFWGL